MHSIKNLFFFYFYPSRETVHSITFKDKVWQTLKLFLLNFIILIFCGAILNGALTAFGMLDEPITKPKIFKSFAVSLLSFAIIGPIIEELMFRIWLLYTRKNISIAFGAIASSLIYKFSLQTVTGSFFQKTIPIVLAMLLGTLVGIAVFFALKKGQFLLKKFSDKNLRILAMASSVIFGYLHIFNYKISLNLLLLSPLVLANYIIGGLILAFTRIRYGLLYAILLHVFYNAILVAIKFR